MTLAYDVTFTGEVHPAAEAWPTLADDELDELAASIADIGLTDPITLDPAGRVLDGRNRLAACERAGVQPTFEVYDGDPVPFILAKNSDRRHMTTGARAMATAVVLAEAGCRRNGRWQRGVLKDQESDRSDGWRVALSNAGLILDYAPDLAQAVIHGDPSLDAAYKRAREAKARAESYTDRLENLRDAAPDLAEKVDREDLTLGEAEAVKKQRDDEAAQRLRHAVKATEDAATGWVWLVNMASDEGIDQQATVIESLADEDRALVDEAIATIRKANR